MHLTKKAVVSLVSLIVFLFFAPLEIVRTVWCKFVLRQSVAIVPGFCDVYAVVLSTVEDALKTMLPGVGEIKEEARSLTDAQKNVISKKAGIEFDAEFDKEFHFFIGRSNGKIAGYVAKDTVKGKWGPITYALALDSSGKITDAMVLEYHERRGAPVANRRFLDQFAGKSISDKIKLKSDIKGVSGATISSRGMANGIRKVVHVFNEFYGQK